MGRMRRQQGKISCSVGGFWFLVLDPFHVILSLVFIVGALERQSRLDKTCMMESNQSKHGRARSAFGIVKHG
ncbi:unnamed protein product, partial [Prunus brigantina]